MKEISTMYLSNKRVIPIVVDNSPISDYLSNYLAINLSNDFEAGLIKLINGLKKTEKQIDTGKINEFKRNNYNSKITVLKSEYSTGNLTLVCGAGVSISAGVPAWNDLLLSLLEIAIEKISNSNIDLVNVDPEEFNSV